MTLRSWYEKYGLLLNRSLSIFLGLALWQVVAAEIVRDPGILVSPLVVIQQGYEFLFVTGELLPHVVVSFREFLIGYVVSVLVGIPFGFLMALSPGLRDVVNPWVTALYSTPRIAFAPLLVLWFGIGISSKVAIIFSGCIFPILINSFYGIRSVDRTFVELAQAFRLRKRDLFFKIMIPGSLPYLLAGLRLAVGRGLVGVAIAEWFGANAGLGFIVYMAGQTFNIPLLFVGICLFALMGILSFEVLRRIESAVAPWQSGREMRRE